MTNIRPIPAPNKTIERMINPINKPLFTIFLVVSVFSCFSIIAGLIPFNSSSKLSHLFTLSSMSLIASSLIFSPKKCFSNSNSLSVFLSTVRLLIALHALS